MSMNRINFLIDENLRKKFKIWCVKNDTTITEVLTKYIKECIDEEKRT